MGVASKFIQHDKGQSAGKIMLVAYGDSRGIILANFMPKGRTVTARFYSVVIVITPQRKKLKK